MTCVLLASLLSFLIVALNVGSARAADGADWLPLRGKAIPVGCTWTPSCGGYHPSNAKAIDFLVPPKTPVFASGKGVVSEVFSGCPSSGYCNGGRGNYVTVKHTSTLYSRYLHLSSLAPGIKKEKEVTAGQLIALSGRSGQNEEAHLHYDELTSPLSGTGKRDPGPLYVCHGSTRKEYGGWPSIPRGTPLRNDGYEFGCARGAISIYALANNRYVSAEKEYTGNRKGMLRARATAIGTWERFQIVGNCRVSPGCAIRALANGRYVSAEKLDPGPQKGMLRARATSIGAWERFIVKGDCTAGCALLARANNRYVAAERAYSGSGKGMLRARSTSVGTWEKFRFKP